MKPNLLLTQIPLSDDHLIRKHKIHHFQDRQTERYLAAVLRSLRFQNWGCVARGISNILHKKYFVEHCSYNKHTALRINLVQYPESRSNWWDVDRNATHIYILKKEKMIIIPLRNGAKSWCYNYFFIYKGRLMKCNRPTHDSFLSASACVNTPFKTDLLWNLMTMDCENIPFKEALC